MNAAVYSGATRAKGGRNRQQVREETKEFGARRPDAKGVYINQIITMTFYDHDGCWVMYDYVSRFQNVGIIIRGAKRVMTQ